jgi:hypothetical protein
MNTLPEPWQFAWTPKLRRSIVFVFPQLSELEKEWLFSFASAESNIKNVKSLLEKDPNLATKKVHDLLL